MYDSQEGARRIHSGHVTAQWSRSPAPVGDPVPAAEIRRLAATDPQPTAAPMTTTRIIQIVRDRLRGGCAEDRNSARRFVSEQARPVALWMGPRCRPPVANALTERTSCQAEIRFQRSRRRALRHVAMSPLAPVRRARCPEVWAIKGCAGSGGRSINAAAVGTAGGAGKQGSAAAAMWVGRQRPRRHSKMRQIGT